MVVSPERYLIRSCQKVWMAMRETTILSAMSITDVPSPQTATPAPASATSPPADSSDASGPGLHQGISPKLTAGALGGAIATLVGVGVAHIFPAISSLELASIVSAVGTLVTFVIGWYMPDPLRVAGNQAVAAAT